VINIKELESYDDKDKNGGPTDKEARKIKFRLLGPLCNVPGSRDLDIEAIFLCQG
jgi:hypothetical protein